MIRYNKAFNSHEEIIDKIINLCCCRCPTTVVKQKWMSHLYQHACDQKRWRQAAVDKMEVIPIIHICLTMN